MIFYSDVNRQDNLVDPKVYDLESIYQSIDSILNTRKGERLFLPEFGVDLEKYLFEPLTFSTQEFVFDEIFLALNRYEPRIDISRRESSVVSNVINHTIDLTIVFSIRGKSFDQYVYQSTLVKQQKDKYYEL